MAMIDPRTPIGKATLRYRGLPTRRGKSPSEWRTKDAKRFSTRPQKMRSARNKLGHDYILASGRFLTKMQICMLLMVVRLRGHGLLKRRLLPMRCGSHLISTLFRKADGRKPERLYKAVKAGHLTKGMALSLIPTGSVWASRVEEL